MLIETVRSVFAHVVDAVEIVMLDRARRRSNAMAVRHIEDLPAYLRRDIGILDDAEIGETLLLVNHVSHDGNNPYRASHAIFVSENATEAAVYEDEIPPALDRRVLSLRAFDEAGMMIDAALAQQIENGLIDPPSHIGGAAARTFLADWPLDGIRFGQC